MTTLVNSFQALITAASRRPSAGEVTALASRQAGASGAIVILADTSGSMDGLAGARRKIDALREAVATLVEEIPEARLLAFSDRAREVESARLLPSPDGGTALHLALRAASAHRPTRTLVVSDGHPDDPEAALVAAAGLTGRIDVVYCGPDGDREAIAFLARLARSTGGRCATSEAGERLLEPMRRLLLGEGGA